jgi:hypothetical protein
LAKLLQDGGIGIEVVPAKKYQQRLLGQFPSA